MHIVEILPIQIRNIGNLVAVLIYAQNYGCFGDNFGSGTDVQVGVTFAIGIGKTGEAQLTFKIPTVDGRIVHMIMAV